MDKVMISIAKQFTDTPAGRYLKDGPFSGERFRTDFLVPPLQAGKVVEVDLDDVLGFGSSFLEEAFGGLVRLGFPAADLHKRLKIRSTLKVYAERIWRYIDDEAKRVAHA